MSYTAAALLAAVGTVALDLLVLRTRLLRRRDFWLTYSLMLAGQFVVNGILTGHRVVTYDPGAILGLRVGFAPVEDLLFGFALVTQTLCWWQFWGPAARTPPAPTPPAPAPATPSGRG